MKLILTAEEQAEAINQYIKREYNLEIKVHSSEYDDKDMEVQPVIQGRSGNFYYL